MPEHSVPFEYDVALSFAREEKTVAEELAGLLKSRDISVFLDEYGPSSTWGKGPVDHLVNLYSRKARYCILLFSEHYPLKQWTDAERTATQQRALRDASEYILPIRVGDTEIPGASQTSGYRDLRQHRMESVVSLLEEKLATTKNPAGPPPQSHDLRSGNVPKTGENENR